MLQKNLFFSLLALLLFGCGQDEGIVTIENDIRGAVEIQMEQEVANRIYFLENHINLVGLNTDNFPLVYQAIFDPLNHDDLNKSSDCDGCDYVPSDCNQFTLYLNLLESACDNGDSDNEVDFCALFENCSKCYAEECGTPDPDPCLGVFCPQGSECQNGICIEVDECERIEASYRQLRNLTREEWLEICGIPNDGPITVEELFECDDYQELIQLQWEYYGCLCSDLGYIDLCDCLC